MSRGIVIDAVVGNAIMKWKDIVGIIIIEESHIQREIALKLNSVELIFNSLIISHGRQSIFTYKAKLTFENSAEIIWLQNLYASANFLLSVPVNLDEPQSSEILKDLSFFLDAEAITSFIAV